MQQDQFTLTAGRESVLAVNKVIRNTYTLLSMTLVFSAVCAGISMAVGIGRGASIGLFVVAFILMFIVRKYANSAKGITLVFAFTGCMGASLGPMLTYYMSMANGPSLVLQALGGTALIFFTLSGYALTTRKDFSFMGGFLLTGLVVMVVAMIANFFLAIPALSLAISAAIIMIMSGLILFDTSRIINGGEKNYIMATVSLYLSILNIFIHLLYLLGVMSDD